MNTNNQYVYGLHAAMAVCKTRANDIECVYTLHGRRDKRLHAIIELAERHQLTIKKIERQALTDLVNDSHHQGIVIRYKHNTASTLIHTEQDLATMLTELTTPALLLILDGVQDPHNLGACLRTADAAGVNAVIAPKDKAASITATVRKVACGATESVPFIQVTNLARTLSMLKTHGVWIYGACANANQSLYQLDGTGSMALVFGSEGDGLRELTRKQCDDMFSIPMLGQVESLNVSVASGISLFEMRRQRLLKCK